MSSINPGRSSGGGGSGTVTSIGGGVGWTPTPDPLTTAGVGNLDINDLTAEASLAAGDLFAFVDVSAAGTPIAQQRKVTFADLSAAIAAGLTVTCATAPDLLCLDGRAGTANDPTISTDQVGTVRGSAAALGALVPGLQLVASASSGGLVSVDGQSILMLEPITAFGFGGGLAFRDASDSFRTLFLAQTQAEDITYFLPTAPASAAGQSIINNGFGLLSWGFAAVDCSSAPDLLCRDGRTGTTNDAVVSTDDNGTITGSDADGKSLVLNGNTGGVAPSNGDPFVLFCKNLNGAEQHSVDALMWTIAGPRPKAAYNLFADGGFLELAHLSGGGLQFVQDDTGGVRTIALRSNTTLRNAAGVDCLSDNEFFLYMPQSPEGALGAKLIADGATLHLARVSGQPTHFVLSSEDSGILNIDALDCFQTVVETVPGTGAINVDEFRPYRVDAQFDTVGDAVCFDVHALTANVFTNTPISYRSRVSEAYMTHAGAAVFGGSDAVPTAGYTIDCLGDMRVDGKLTVTGVIDPTQVIIDNPGGTPPLVVSTTDLNVNLNADLLDGLHASAFASATAPGSTTQVIFNDGGVFGADGGLTYAKSTDILTVGGALQAGTSPYAAAGTVRLPFLGTIAWRNNDDTSDSAAIGVGTGNQLNIISSKVVMVDSLDTSVGGINLAINGQTKLSVTAAGLVQVANDMTIGNVVTSYQGNAKDASHHGMPFTRASASATGQTANVAATTVLASAPAGRYRITALAAVTTGASISSTLPAVQVRYTDNTDGVVKTATVTQTETGNTTATAAGGSALIDVQSGTNIQFLTTGYASNLAGMAYKYYLTLEVL